MMSHTDQTSNRMTEIEAAMDCMDELHASEFPAYKRHTTNSIDAYLLDSDFDATVRNMLCYFEDEGFDIRDFLANESDSDRYLDLIRVYRMLSFLADPNEYRRDELSHLYMRYSLCPIHHGDWAGCFDDDEADCAQIRAIFPHSHDT